MKLSGKYITVPLARRIVGLPGHASSRFNGCVRMKILEGRGSKAPGRLGAMSLFATSAKSCAGTRNRK